MRVKARKLGMVAFSLLDEKTQGDVIDGLLEYKDDDPDFVAFAAQGSSFPVVEISVLDAAAMASVRPLISRSNLLKYTRKWVKGAEFPPIVISSRRGIMYAGTHRSLSAQAAGVPFIQAIDLSGAKLDGETFVFPV